MEEFDFGIFYVFDLFDVSIQLPQLNFFLFGRGFDVFLAL